MDVHEYNFFHDLPPAPWLVPLWWWWCLLDSWRSTPPPPPSLGWRWLEVCLEEAWLSAPPPPLSRDDGWSLDEDWWWWWWPWCSIVLKDDIEVPGKKLAETMTNKFKSCENVNADVWPTLAPTKIWKIKYLQCSHVDKTFQNCYRKQFLGQRKHNRTQTWMYF